MSEDPTASPQTESEPDRELEDAALDYFTLLQERLVHQESQFDTAVLLIAGGAFTVSAAFVPQIHGSLQCESALAVSWVAWALCLLVSISSFLFSAHCSTVIIQRINDGVRDRDKLEYAPARWIPRINYTAFALLLIGFIGFGLFTFGNLKFEGAIHVESKKEVSKEGCQEVQGVSARDQCSFTESALGAQEKTATRVGGYR